VLLQLPFEKFDQDLNGGWRPIENNGCHELVLDLIVTYLNIHKENLMKWQINILIWHSGQIYALNDNYIEAIERFKKTINRDEPQDDAFKWNAYVKGSIAFLEKDKNALKLAINDLEKATNPNSIINLNILKSFDRCFNRPYREAYVPTCGI